MVKFNPQQAMKAQSGRSMPIPLGKVTSNHCTEAGWGLGPILTGAESPPPPPPEHPAQSESLYRPHYPDYDYNDHYKLDL